MISKKMKNYYFIFIFFIIIIIIIIIIFKIIISNKPIDDIKSFEKGKIEASSHLNYGEYVYFPNSLESSKDKKHIQKKKVN